MDAPRAQTEAEDSASARHDGRDPKQAQPAARCKLCSSRSAPVCDCSQCKDKDKDGCPRCQRRKCNAAMNKEDGGCVATKIEDDGASVSVLIRPNGTDGLADSIASYRAEPETDEDARLATVWQSNSCEPAEPASCHSDSKLVHVSIVPYANRGSSLDMDMEQQNPKKRTKTQKRIARAIVVVSFLLLAMSVALVAITLTLSQHIDEMIRKNIYGGDYPSKGIHKGNTTTRPSSR